ncbi:HIT domain-containing protein [Mailhella massiliensis]|uniref:HIT domain-containing protein n=1 Tax=Mailhella massiliensis TaxID=1903261 RepID=A0A921AVP4_9BACT|nr:HIT domain-containing protein [Mailhella massiliensis]HJD96926.1 HIT domain-containing protein [Mailhella massiliensis]
MKNLWAPWRMQYILGPKPHDGCVLCAPENPAEDEERLIVYRAAHVFVMLNRYPYASGHLMVLPYRHVGDVTDLTAEEASELMEVAQLCCRVLRETCRPQGINVGLNLGAAAGAGLGEHLHMHVVPRWSGDSNFIAVLGDVRVIPEALEETRRRLAPVFAALSACSV